MTQAAFVPTPDHREQVALLTGYGLTEAQVCQMITNPSTGNPISERTLRRHFKRELAAGAVVANASVAQTLFNMATSGECPAATIFWMKSRVGWRETFHFVVNKPVAEMDDVEFNRLLIAHGREPIDLSIGAGDEVTPFPGKGRR
jgi:hypothetical protein